MSPTNYRNPPQPPTLRNALTSRYPSISVGIICEFVIKNDIWIAQMAEKGMISPLSLNKFVVWEIYP
jgi:hypothetical protein